MGSQKEPVLYKTEPGKKLARIILNRPEVLNALVRDDYTLIREYMDKAERDDNVKVIILQGSGPSFCCGHNIEELGGMWGLSREKGARRPSQRQKILCDYPLTGVWNVGFLAVLKPVIAMVHGYVLGGGALMALCSDIVIASEDALGFAHAAWRYGGPAAEGVNHLWFAKMGISKALELMWTGRWLTAQEAKECGVVAKVVARDRLEEEALKMAEKIAMLPLDSIVISKLAVLDEYERLGLLDHAGQTFRHLGIENLRMEPGEWNFFGRRRDLGTRGVLEMSKALHADQQEYLPDSGDK